jgi:hypothetical protein
MCFWCTFEFMVLFFISNFTSGICAVGQSSRWISFKTNIVESVHCLEDIKEGMHKHSVHGDFITPLLPCQGIKLGYKLHVINVLKKKVCPCNILKQSYFRWPHQVLKKYFDVFVPKYILVFNHGTCKYIYFLGYLWRGRGRHLNIWRSWNFIIFSVCKIKRRPGSKTS